MKRNARLLPSVCLASASRSRRCSLSTWAIGSDSIGSSSRTVHYRI